MALRGLHTLDLWSWADREAVVSSGISCTCWEAWRRKWQGPVKDWERKHGGEGGVQAGAGAVKQ